MSFVRILIHAVWGTKHRASVMSPDIRAQLCNHIQENAREKNIHIDTIDGHYDHLHALMYLNTDLSISKQMQLLKGESSHWMNKQSIMDQKFQWADEYFAESVSPRDIDAVRNYIKNQKTHHEKLTFQQECTKFFDAWSEKKVGG